MAEAQVVVHGDIIRAALSGEVDLDATTDIYWMCTGAGYTIDQDDVFESELTDIVSGTNLPSAGVAAAGASVTYDAASNSTTFRVDDLNRSSVTASGIQNVHLVYKAGGSPSSNRLIMSASFHEDGDPGTPTTLNPEAGALTFDVPPAGIFSIPV